jgi:tetratricopeptide (TPR) repeat protein
MNFDVIVMMECGKELPHVEILEDASMLLITVTCFAHNSIVFLLPSLAHIFFYISSSLSTFITITIMDQAKRGAEALNAGNYAEAIEEYTAALAVSPTSPDYLIKRSTAYQRSSPANYTLALVDANKAVINAQKRGKRELIIQGQLRRAIALFGLERYADAKFVFDVVKRMDPKEKTLPIWETKINTKMTAADTGQRDTRRGGGRNHKPSQARDTDKHFFIIIITTCCRHTNTSQQDPP